MAEAASGQPKIGAAPNEKSREKQGFMGQGVEIDVFGPLTFWLVILVIGVILELIIAPIASSLGNSGLQSLVIAISGYILYLPGAVILPLVVAVWLGERVGATKNNVGPAVNIGLVNAAYTALIYAVAIFIIYLLIKYITPGFLSAVSLTMFLEFVVIIPIVIVVALIPFIAALSAARHSNLQ